MITEVSDFLKMSSDELYDHLISYAMTMPQAKSAIEELRASERYSCDYAFRAMVDFSDILNDNVRNGLQPERLKDRLMGCIEIMERATNLEMWQLVANTWVAMGNFYQQSFLFERALECFTYALGIEEEHGLFSLSPIIYLNMILIFVDFNEFDKSLELVKKAEALLEKYGDRIPRYITKYILVQEWYLRIKVIQGVSDQEELKVYYDRIMQAPVDKLTHPYEAVILSCNYYYGLLFFEREEFHAILMKIKEKFGTLEYVLHLQHCIELLRRFDREVEYYLQELAKFEEDDHLFPPQVNVSTYKFLSEYYQSKGIEDKLASSRLKYLKACEQHFEVVRKQQNFALHTIEELLLNEEFKKKSNVENMEFKLIANEAIYTKRELEKAYERIAIIGELGKKLTATTDLDEVIRTIFRVIKDHLMVDYFALWYYDEENRCLRSVAIYYKEQLQKRMVIDIDDEKSSSARCYKTKEILKYSGRINSDKAKVHVYDHSEMLSSVFMPLVVADKAIGVFSLQTRQEKAYEGEGFEFLKEIEPYLSIALNNAVKSWLIEREGEKRRKIQKELEDANAILSKISSMDGLTQISSRRAFEEKFKECIALTKDKQTSVCVFMMDIDFFKLYNDTYGHLQGDEVLKMVAKIFRTRLKAVHGLSARFGGEEFIGAVSGLSKEEAQEVAENIRKEIISANIVHEASPLGSISVSIGIAITNEVTREVEHDIRSKLMKLADECLYEAKASGKNTYVIQQLSFE